MTDDLIANARRLAHDLIDAVVRVQYDVVADTLLALADECERQRIYVHELAEQSLALQAMYHEAEQDADRLAEAMSALGCFAWVLLAAVITTGILVNTWMHLRGH